LEKERGRGPSRVSGGKKLTFSDLDGWKSYHDTCRKRGGKGMMGDKGLSEGGKRVRSLFYGRKSPRGEVAGQMGRDQ